VSVKNTLFINKKKITSQPYYCYHVELFWCTKGKKKQKREKERKGEREKKKNNDPLVSSLQSQF